MTPWILTGSGARRLLLVVAAGMSGSPAVAAPQALVPPVAAVGSELTVYLMTMGQGDQIWEKFGHNAIGVRDERAGTDVVYNWGMFSFQQPGFIPRFLRGEMYYWMAPFDASQTVQAYSAWNRSITIQELNLEPAARAALRDFLVWNAREENKYYAYDYFRDNCSTRARDAIDRAVGGALRSQLQSVTTSQSYRDHALRLTQDDAAISTGIDIGLGLSTDRHITAWEESFVPMSLRDRIRAVEVSGADGRMVKLVRAERTVFASTRSPEAATPANRAPWFFLFGAGTALVLVILAKRASSGLRWARALVLAWCVAWAAGVGLLGTVLVLLWAATRHVAAYQNINLFHFQPLWLAVAIAALVAALKGGRGAGAPAASLVRVLVLFGGTLSMVGFVALAITSLRQGFGAPVALAAPLNLAVAFALLRLFPSTPAARHA